MKIGLKCSIWHYLLKKYSDIHSWSHVVKIGMKAISLHFKSSLKIGQLHKYSRGHQLSSYDHHTYYEQNYLTPKDIIWEKLVEGDIQSGAHLWGSILNTIAPGTQTLKPIATIDREGLIFMAVDTQVRTSSGLVVIQLLSLATDDHNYGAERRRRTTAPATWFNQQRKYVQRDRSHQSDSLDVSCGAEKLKQYT